MTDEKTVEREPVVTSDAAQGDETAAGAVAGVIGGAAVGAVVGGPVGAVVGGAVGGTAGATVGAIDTRDKDEVVVTTEKVGS